MTIEEKAQQMTVKHYLSRGYFGGKSKISGGAVVGKEYFNFAKVKQQYIDELTALENKHVSTPTKAEQKTTTI